MTDAELLAAVSACIASGLDAAYWASQSATQAAACRMAAGDIFARLSGVSQETVTDTAGSLISAIAEQAVFLLRTHEERAEGKVITGESVEGLSASYTLLGGANADGVLAPRAAAYLERAKKALRASGKFRFGRG